MTTEQPCDHKPDFYPSLMRWECTVCGAPLRVTNLYSAWREAMKTEKAPKQGKETA